MKAKGIINRDPKRVFKLEEKMINLIINNGYCLGCGDYVMLKDSHGAHDKAWDDGGATIDCITTCGGCNINQGKMLFDEWMESDRRKQYLIKKGKKNG
tara:strand:- start:219 stop:512 length:294 start_codon:yes stop_codon:yes gene_type:complete